MHVTIDGKSETDIYNLNLISESAEEQLRPCLPPLMDEYKRLDFYVVTQLDVPWYRDIHYHCSCPELYKCGACEHAILSLDLSNI